MHPLKGKVHIDGLLYEPDEKYPFWKLATAGASDIKMPPVKNTLANCNEYMMFIDPKEDMLDPDVRYWYYKRRNLSPMGTVWNGLRKTARK